jgi:hypothetical protein
MPMLPMLHQSRDNQLHKPKSFITANASYSTNEKQTLKNPET